ncbi:hypothetical protein B566_EDAN013870 [Ephemera danica]|nr:hypothetical protein B566_EDAN013870 [Ephemera danica]
MEADENAEDASWGQEQQDKNKQAEQNALIATMEEQVKSPTDEPETAAAADVADENAGEDVEAIEEKLDTVDETDIVVRAIQQLVTLPRLNTALWSDEARTPLRRFVEEHSEEALCIALVDDQLVATSGPQLPEGASPTNPHMLFGELGRTQYAAKGLTLLYIPTEGFHNEAEVPDDNSIMLGRLEDDNMRFLEQQLYGESVQQILPLLEAAQSDAARLLRSIISQAAEGKKEAKSNRKVLSALVSPSNEVAACKSLTTELVPKAVTLINTARVVWLHAPHFKSRSRVTQLFSCLSHQIIDVCTRTVNLRAIFRGRPVYGIARLSECISTCRDYMRVYEEVAEKHRKYTEHDWEIDSQEIFSSVYTFITRCKDLKEVCEAIMIFGRINERESVAKPKFVGMNGAHFSQICESIMFDTKKEVELLAQRKHEALDVTCNTWQEGMDRFRQQMTKVERRVVALTHGVMEKATTVEEGLQALASLAHYLQKPSLHNLLEEKSNLVYNLLLTCIDSVSRSVLGGETLGCEDTPPYSGAALVAQLNKNHLKQQLKMLKESKHLAKQCEQREVVTRECKFITEVLDEVTQEYYDRWAAAALISDWEARLRRPLLTNSPVIAGAIETTLSRHVLEILAEARVWNNLGFKTPGHVRELCNGEENLNELRKNMVTICKTYNDALASSYILFQTLKNFKLVAGQFHEDCESILLACRKIANARLVNIQPECLYQTKQLKNDLRNAIKPQYESMLKLLANIKRGLRTSHSQDIHWVNFVSKISDLAEEAIIIAVRNELQKLLNILMENPDVLVHLRATIKNEEITFEPSIGEVQSIVMHTLDCIKRHSKSVPSIMESIKLQSKKKKIHNSLSAKIFEDSKCQELQCHLNEAMESCAEQLRQYAESWEQLSWVWKIDRDKFEAEYRSKKPVASAVAQDTDRMLSMLEDANISTSCVIMFVNVDATDVQTTLQSHVEGWRHVLLNLMLFSTQTLTEKFQLDLESDISKLLKEPSTLQEVAEKTIFCQIATVHIPCKENALKLVEEHKEILAHYKIQIPQNLQQLLSGIRDKWNEYISTVNAAKDSLEISKESFRSSLVDNGNVLTRELTKVCSEVHKSGPFDTAWEETDALQFLETLKKTLTEIQVKKEALGRDFELFGIEPPALPELTDIQTVHVISKKLSRLAREPAREWPVLEKTRNEVENLRHALPLVLQLRNPAMRPRHWQSVQTALHRYPTLSHFDPKSDEFTLKEAMTMGITNFEEEIKAISRDASMEFEIETGLSEITKAWETMKLEFEQKSASKSNKMQKMKSVELICSLTDQHLADVAAMEASSKFLQVTGDNNASYRYVSPFLAEVKSWKGKLNCLIEVLESLIAMETKLLEIEPILLNAGYADKLKQLHHKIDEVNKILAQYLIKKCIVCPRLYFLSTREQTRLLQCGTNLKSVRDVLCKCFPGCKDTTSFEWLSQLRYYRSSDSNANVEIRQMFGVFTHGLEYYGDPQQLVMTPQTDRCILHITTLLYLKMAGLMQGPSGCGKTEILKGLAMNLGRFLFIANCSRVINYLGFRSILTGEYGGTKFIVKVEI